ncbi:hypothetical protein [Lacipirellula parvula]|uniref:Uncharacterized protein n=1 Tax=Lacipirellula parvula TaxID=2650471 RepID=A0A5K7XMG4_9BACT|nr:hypothetical protein [Lacipirellula parvula]BBO35793.1 hypothetical protein PLANPX_5405 [Lacipirellula parvula]
MPRQSNFPSLRLFLSLTIGVAAIWIVAAGMGVSVVGSFSQPRSTESLCIAIDGEPLLDRYVISNGGSRRLPYKTLAGEEVPRNRELANPVILVGNNRPLPWTEGPINWGNRILWCEDHLRWFVVRDAAVDGRAYLVGYNRESKLPSQYLSRAGFQFTPPDKEDYFEVGPRFYHSTGLVTGRKLSGLSFSNQYSGLDIGGATPTPNIYLFDGDDLLEIKLQALSTEKIAAIPRPLALTMAGVPASRAQAGEAKQAAAGQEADEDFQAIQAPRNPRLVIRTTERVVLLNPSNGEQVEYRLPADLHGAAVNVYPVTNERLVVERLENTPTATIRHLTWLSPASEVLRTEEVTTNRREETTPFAAAIILCLAAPLLLLYAPSMVWFAPLGWVEVHPGSTFGEALQEITVGSWQVSLGLFVLSTVLAVFVYRWQRENNRPRPVAWAVAAFLLGVPGFIAYLILYGRPSVARARTRKIATTEPKLLGIEIFA